MSLKRANLQLDLCLEDSGIKSIRLSQNSKTTNLPVHQRTRKIY